ncbi:MAG TPA: DUF2975 domain-containing protein [Opitutaceae bacterium]|nr:DUF2975 domain-containing protein [Opitutaceae bacterium]
MGAQTAPPCALCRCFGCARRDADFTSISPWLHPGFTGGTDTGRTMTNANLDHVHSAASVRGLRRIKFSALGLSALMLAGIAALMVLAAGKDEDIAGIVAPALLIALLSGAVAAVATVLQKRREKGR